MPEPPAPRVGDILDLTVESVAYRGSGVARHMGCVVFVPGTITGEKIAARVVRTRRSYVQAELIEVLDPSPHRIERCCMLDTQPPLPMPGCVYDHMLYAEELRVKRLQLSDLLVRPGWCAEQDIGALHAAPEPLHYRNKSVLHVGRRPDGSSVLGYVADDNHTVIDTPACVLSQPAINAHLAALRAQPDFGARLASHERLTLRCTEIDGAVSWWDRPVFSAPTLTESTRLGLLKVPRGAFFQVHPHIADAMLGVVIDELRELAPHAVIDLFCGVGVFALAAASIGIEIVIGADRDREAIRAASGNAARLGLKPRFLATDAGSVARTHLKRLPRDRTCVLLDPPRAGLDPALRTALKSLLPRTLLIVSCAPDTLARDLRELATVGYRVARVHAFDMFPRTVPIEVVTRLTRD